MKSENKIQIHKIGGREPTGNELLKSLQPIFDVKIHEMFMWLTEENNMKNLPKKIYLNFGDDFMTAEDYATTDFRDLSDIRWCEDRQDEFDHCYVDESEIESLKAENERLRNLPSEILAELKTVRFVHSELSQEPVVEWCDIEEIFAKFAQSDSDKNSKGENENAQANRI